MPMFAGVISPTKIIFYVFCVFSGLACYDWLMPTLTYLKPRLNQRVIRDDLTAQCSECEEWKTIGIPGHFIEDNIASEFYMGKPMYAYVDYPDGHTVWYGKPYSRCIACMKQKYVPRGTMGTSEEDASYLLALSDPHGNPLLSDAEIWTQYGYPPTGPPA